ncbi:MAG: tetratricopeptide repeat protein [Desulfobacterota bacterium]|nr:tetratricopeptide repeat protein [Thermodesulfobacteriota bacterium]
MFFSIYKLLLLHTPQIRCTSFIFILIILCFPLHTLAFDEKIQPITAFFSILPSSSRSWADVQVSMHIVLHNNDEGSVIGKKFLCVNNIDSIRVTDDAGNNLAYTIKNYPRKRIFWEYGKPKNNIRSANLQFIMRRSVQKEHGACTFVIDWINGWNRPVYDASYTISFPYQINKEDIITVTPSTYVLTSDARQSHIQFSFPSPINIQTLKIVYKDKDALHSENNIKGDNTQNKVVSSSPENERAGHVLNTISPQPEPPSISGHQIKETLKKQVASIPQKQSSSQALIKKIRHSIGKNYDRIVFDLSLPIAYEFVRPEDSSEAELVWNTPISILDYSLTKKKISSSRVVGLRWKSTPEKRLSCIIELAGNHFKISHGLLDNPPRIYIDITDTELSTSTVKPVESTSVKAFDNATKSIETLPSQLTSHNPIYGFSNNNAVGQEILQRAPTTAHSTTSSPPYVYAEDTHLLDQITNQEEKLSYQKAKKLFEVGEFQKALSAYEKILKLFPSTRLEEYILFDIADALYALAEHQDLKNFMDALQAYKKALAHYPESSRAAHALFQIAQCYRKSELYIEASAQYPLVVQRYPTSVYAAEARYWTAECLFRLRKFEDALREFEQFSRDFSTGPYSREAAFRIGDCYAELKDFERAEFYYDKALKRWPDILSLPYDTLNNMGKTNYFKGKFEKSRSFFILSFNLYPSQKNPGQVLRFIADSYQWEGNMQKALNIYGLIVDMFPDTDEALLAIMRIADLGVNVAGLHADRLTFQGFNPYQQPEQAYQWIIEHTKSPEILSESYYKLGFTLAKKGDLITAIDYFKKSMMQPEKGMYYARSFENIQKILTRIIHTAVEQGDYANVIETYKKNETVFLNQIIDCQFYYDVAKSYVEIGLITAAKELISKKISSSDHNVECFQRATILLSSVDIAQGNIESGRERLFSLIYGNNLLNSVSSDAYHVLGDSFYYEKRYQEAIAAYTQATHNGEALTFRDMRTLIRMGDAFGKISLYANGIQTIKKMLAAADKLQKPTRREIQDIIDNAILMLGSFYIKNNDYGAAQSTFQHLIEKTSNSQIKGWAYLQWGDVLVKQGKEENATRIFQEMIATVSDPFLSEIARSKISSIQWRKNNQYEIQKLL